MTAGRKPKPAALKLLEGRGDGRDSGGRPVVQPPGFTRLPPEPPSWLSGHAREEWERILPELQRLHLTKPIDRASLTAYCLAWERLAKARAEIEADGGSVLGENSQGVVRHPAVAVMEAASKDLRAWAAEFGLTPAAEVRVARPEGADDGESNPFAEGDAGAG